MASRFLNRLAVQSSKMRGIAALTAPQRSVFPQPNIRLFSTNDLGPIDPTTSATITERAERMKAEHHRFRETYPESAQPSVGTPVDAKLAHRKKLIYRSKQRGWLEVDLILGSWAEDNVMNLSDTELEEFERIMNMETLDIFNLLTRKMTPPPGEFGPVLQAVQDYASTSPAGVADPSQYAEIKKKMSN